MKKTLLAHLGHANTRAFLSHGGLNSIYEAMYHGVPVVGVPLFGDHYDTMTRVAAKGMGILIHWKYMTEEDLFVALTSIIKDTRLDLRLVRYAHTNDLCISVIIRVCQSHPVIIHGVTSKNPKLYCGFSQTPRTHPVSLYAKVPPASTSPLQHSQRSARPPCDEGRLLDQLHPPSQRCQPPALSCIRGVPLPVLPAGCDCYCSCCLGSHKLCPA